MDAKLVAVRDDVLERLADLPGLRSGAMFGCYGLYAEDALFFGIVGLDGRVYFRTDEQTRAPYAERAMPAFDYDGTKPPSDTYLAVPEDVVADAGALLTWAEAALDATRRAKATKGAKRRR